MHSGEPLDAGERAAGVEPALFPSRALRAAADDRLPRLGEGSGGDNADRVLK